jgi:hypothetical protein
LAHLDRADAGLDRSFRHLASADDALVAILRGKMSMGGECLGNLRLDSLGRQLRCAIAQDFR